MEDYNQLYREYEEILSSNAGFILKECIRRHTTLFNLEFKPDVVFKCFCLSFHDSFGRFLEDNMCFSDDIDVSINQNIVTTLLSFRKIDYIFKIKFQQIMSL
jgi:hypothetical protein